MRSRRRGKKSRRTSTRRHYRLQRQRKKNVLVKKSKGHAYNCFQDSTARSPGSTWARTSTSASRLQEALGLERVDPRRR